MTDTFPRAGSRTGNGLCIAVDRHHHVAVHIGHVVDTQRIVASLRSVVVERQRLVSGNEAHIFATRAESIVGHRGSIVERGILSLDTVGGRFDLQCHILSVGTGEVTAETAYLNLFGSHISLSAEVDQLLVSVVGTDRLSLIDTLQFHVTGTHSLGTALHYGEVGEIEGLVDRLAGIDQHRHMSRNLVGQTELDGVAIHGSVGSDFRARSEESVNECLVGIEGQTERLPLFSLQREVKIGLGLQHRLV